MTTLVLWAALSQNHSLRRTPAEARRLVHDLLADCMAERTYALGHVFCTQDDFFSSVVFVCSGYAKVVHRSATGRETLLSVGGPNSVIGASEVLTNNAAGGTVACATEVTAGIVSAPAFKLRAAEDQRLTHLLLCLQSESALLQNGMLLDLVTSTARERVERFLRDLATAQHPPASQQASSVSLHLPISQRELAEFLHIVPETLCRILTALEREGVIRRCQSRLDLDLRLLDWALGNHGQRTRGKMEPRRPQHSGTTFSLVLEGQR